MVSCRLYFLTEPKRVVPPSVPFPNPIVMVLSYPWFSTCLPPFLPANMVFIAKLFSAEYQRMVSSRVSEYQDLVAANPDPPLKQRKLSPAPDESDEPDAKSLNRREVNNRFRGLGKHSRKSVPAQPFRISSWAPPDFVIKSGILQNRTLEIRQECCGYSEYWYWSSWFGGEYADYDYDWYSFECRYLGPEVPYTW